MSTLIDLQRPIRQEPRKGRQPAVNVYRCANGHEVRVTIRWRGGPPPGGIGCPQCDVTKGEVQS